MIEPERDRSDLVNHLCRSIGLPPAEAEHLVGEVLAYFSETLEDFVRRRHRELRSKGLTNDVIYGMIEEEIPRQRVRPPARSQRQIRRIVYG